MPFVEAPMSGSDVFGAADPSPAKPKGRRVTTESLQKVMRDTKASPGQAFRFVRVWETVREVLVGRDMTELLDHVEKTYIVGNPATAETVHRFAEDAEVARAPMDVRLLLFCGVEAWLALNDGDAEERDRRRQEESVARLSALEAVARPRVP